MVLVSLVEVDRPARRRRAPDADRHGVDHLLKLLLAPPERLFRAHLIVDVVAETVPLDDASVLIPHRLGAARHPVIDTIGAAQTISQREALAGGEAMMERIAEPCCVVRMDGLYDRLQPAHARFVRIRDVQAEEIDHALVEEDRLAVGGRDARRGSEPYRRAARAPAPGRAMHGTQRQLMLPGYGRHDERRKCRDGQKKLQHDLPLPLGFRIADKLAGAGYRECHRDQSEEGQSDGGASELEAHRGPKKGRHDDVGGGQIDRSRKGRRHPGRSAPGRRLPPIARPRVGSCRASSGSRPVPVALRSRPRWRLQSKTAAIAAAKVCDCMPNHASVALPTVALTTGAIPAPSTTNARTSCKRFQPNRTPACPVHEPCADRRAKSVADIDQKAPQAADCGTTRTARTSPPDSPPVPTTASCTER